MKNKIIDAIKRLFPGVNLSKNRLDAIAAKLENKVTEENLDEKLTEYNDLMDLTQIAKDDDRLRTAESKVPKTTTTTPKEPAAEPEETDPMKIMLNELKALREDVSNMKAKETQQTLAQKFAANEKFKDYKIPETLLKKFVPGKEEDLETAADELIGVWKPLADSQKTVGHEEPNPFATAYRPKEAIPANPKDAKVDPDIVAFAKSKHQIVQKTT